MKYGADILVAISGRLTEYLENNKISLEITNPIIIDETDKMLDMGFEPLKYQYFDQLK